MNGRMETILRRPLSPKTVVVLCLLLVVMTVLLFPLLPRALFLGMPAVSEDFDCDDSALFMAERLSSMGIPSTPVLGKLTTTAETYLQSDHVWIVADVLGWRVPLDWGKLRWDGQHLEGYFLSASELQFFVKQDRQLHASAAGGPEQTPFATGRAPPLIFSATDPWQAEESRWRTY